MTRFWVSSHAVRRYIERVEPTASPADAREALRQIGSFGKVRSRPRHWMRADIEPAPGLSFVISSSRPHVCLLVRDRVVLTVITRAMCSRRGYYLKAVDSDRRRRDSARHDRWRWVDVIQGEAA